MFLGFGSLGKIGPKIFVEVGYEYICFYIFAFLVFGSFLFGRDIGT